MRKAARHFVLNVGIALALHEGVAFAAPSDAAGAAREHFAEGVKAFQRGDYEGARRLFKQADGEHHAAPIVYNIGLAEERLGHPQAAVDAYEAYLAEAGSGGDLAEAAAVALAQVKARSTKVRIDTQPSGARIFVDGAPLAEPAPVATYVTMGRHVVVAQGTDWRSERDIEARGAGDVLALSLVRKDEAAPVPVAPPPSDPGRSRETPEPKKEDSVPDGFVWGAAFAITPYYLRGVTTPGANNAQSTRSVVAGPMLEGGIALTDHFEFLGRVFFELGPDGKPTYAYMGGPSLAYRVVRPFWLGATFIGGELASKVDGVPYQTDLVYGAIFDASLAVITKPEGQWMASVQPGVLLTEQRNDNTALFLHFTFGFRAY